MSKGDGASGGAMGAGGVAARSAAIAGLFVGAAVTAGAGWAIYRASRNLVNIDTNPWAITLDLARYLAANHGRLTDRDVVTVRSGAQVIPIGTGRQIRRAMRRKNSAVRKRVDELLEAA